MKTRTRVQAALLGVGVALPNLLSNQTASAATTGKSVAPTKYATDETPFCWTIMLSPEQMKAKQRSEVSCHATHAEAVEAHDLKVAALETQAAMSTNGPIYLGNGSTNRATHYDGVGGTGAQVEVYGTCDGSGVSFAAGDPNNDFFASTRHRTGCGRIKHYDDAGFGGAYWTTQPANAQMNNVNDCNGYLENLPDGNPWLADRVSSVKYFAS